MESEKKSDVTSKRRCFNQTSHTYSEKTEHMLVRNVAAGTNHYGFGQAHSAKVSELKFSEDSLPYLNSSLDADIEIYNKQRMRICCARVDENKEEADTLGRACDNTHFNCGVCDDCRQSHLDEDSQLEYLSAHEQDFDDGNSSSKFSEQRGTIGIETLKLTDPVHEVPEGGVTTEQNLVDMSEDCSEYGVGAPTCLEAATPELPHLLQASLSLQDSSDHQEEQTEYHSVVCGSILESHSYGSKEAVCPNLLVCDSLESEEVKDTPLIGGRLLPQIATSEEVLEKNDRHSQHLNEARQSLTLAMGKGPCSSRAEAVQFCKCAEDSDFYSCEESVVCARGTSYTVMDAETQFPVSAVLTSKNPFFGVEAADESLCGNTSCLNLVRCETLKKVTSDSAVNQAVDVSSDFRACFTTSRSTSAQVCLSSRAINTEITMMNKSRPAEWCRESCADVACNTDWSCGACSTEEICSQLTGTVEKHSDGNTATAEISSLQEQRISKNELCSSCLKISTDRPIHLDKQTVKNSTSSCCQKILQRAIEAELQTLNTHYQMCYQHCLKIYKLALEETTCFSRCNRNIELCSSLMLVLEELKENYNRMRMKIKMGIPLNALPPLSVEMKLSPISSPYVPSKFFREDLCYEKAYGTACLRAMSSSFISVSGTRKADFEAPKLQERKISVNMDNPQLVCLTDASQPSESTSSKTFEGQHKDQDVECGCVKNEEGNEYWFDAKEDLTVPDFSVISEETEKQQEKQDMVDVRETKKIESGNECFICIGGLSSSVSEGDLRSHFQKYQISDILMCVDSGNYRYAFICFKEANKAKLAVEEMNEKKIKGKTISVEFVKHSSLVSQILTNKLWPEIQPVDSSQRKDQDKTLTSASNAVKAPYAISAAEKTQLLPIAPSKISCSTQVPSEAKCPHLKSSSEDSVHYLIGVNQKDTGENFLQKTSAPFSTNSYEAFIPLNTLNLSSFTKLMKKLQEMHPEASRDKIVDALLEVKKNNKGILSGLPISTIRERTSAILRKSTPSCG
nr:RNA-binding protein 44 isoform X1 [Columba livia]XP_021142254.1 RNA-binding protein 44 isoform X1 [Columba livia]XP_021142255.1 RNA-binding protein 44 isoform X1 [Columba livia]XP_021142256.1 RNA-binding protein 44 isoform X1 [Columba livia]XP_021142258.1 RNA-binding protein 44 isoform X1 [Columba livia]XP_021142259.1 RNA-binding protein 44 isoform X1 [Columba livia]XP_021142260.1 RNA-binding protein 44 isoform X1 [Columba livia]XP_021142261.1 RNA-binding protein 44 isoform X1 [Columba li